MSDSYTSFDGVLFRLVSQTASAAATVQVPSARSGRHGYQLVGPSEATPGPTLVPQAV
jgi:hypothetical protein